MQVSVIKQEMFVKNLTPLPKLLEKAWPLTY